MPSPLLYAGFVPLSQLLVYIALPFWAVSKTFKGESFLERLACSLLFGLTSQAFLGTVWHFFVPLDPGFNAAVYVVGWLFFGFLSRSGSFPKSKCCFSSVEGCFLGFIFLFGFVTRMIHPLETPALGQSDAYTHLTMFRELMAGDRWMSFYPPAYARVFLLPATLFRIDPYTMARFGGAFFGLGLGLSGSFLVHRVTKSSVTTLLSAALLCCFPGFMLLYKTSLGAFPNQAGLLLLPYVFYGFCQPASRRSMGIGAVAVAGLILLVPMMFLHVCWIGASFFILWELSQRSPTVKKGLILVGFLLFAVWWVYIGSPWVIPERHFGQYSRILVSGGESGLGESIFEQLSYAESIQMMLKDYFSLKRTGLGSVLFNTVAWVLALLFLGVCIFGCITKRKFPTLMGLWGGWTLLQTVFGITQFTSYQREGWSLLIATGIVGGWLGGLMVSKYPFLLKPAYGAVGFSMVACLIFPPRHSLSTSTMEAEWIELVRWMEHPESLPESHPLSQVTEPLLRLWDTEEHLFVVTRPLLQETMLSSVIKSPQNIFFSKGGIWRDYKQKIAQSSQTLVLLDPQPENPSATGVFSQVSPEALNMFSKQQMRSYNLNRAYTRFLLNLDPETFEVTSLQTSWGFRAYFIRKIPAELTENF